jgi:TolB protein
MIRRSMTPWLRRRLIVAALALTLLLSALMRVCMALAPPGDAIAFVSDRAGSRYDLYVIAPERGSIIRLTNTAEWEFFPAWSPDGRALLYSTHSGVTSVLYVMRFGGWGSATRISEIYRALSPERSQAIWMPDGETILFDAPADGGFTLFTIPARGGGQAQPLFADFTEGYRPTVAPDGLTIAFQRSTAGVDTIFLYSLIDHTLTTLTRQSGVSFSPVWSPQGDQIAFAAVTDVNTDLMVIPASGGRARRLTLHPADDSLPTWSPDGRRLAFRSTRSGASDLYILDLATNEVSRLTDHPASDTMPAWRP